MDMISALNSINSTKKNLMRDESGRVVEAEVKGYPSFPVARSLSYHQDAILVVNMLNEIGSRGFNLTPQMHYEFLLHVLPKGKRFAKWAKPQSEADIEMVMDTYPLSYEKAKDIVSLMSQDDLVALRGAKGGDEKKTRAKR